MRHLLQAFSRPFTFFATLFSHLPPIEADGSIMPPRQIYTWRHTLFWFAAIFITSTVYFLIYFTPVHLHDISHFATAAVSLVRDQKDLTYPYQGPTYEAFQAHTAVLDSRTNYPSKLYSALLGVIYLAAGRMRLEYTQWLSFGALVFVNALLYLIGRRFFSGLRLASFLVAISFLPVMRFTLNPGIDIFGYLGLLLLFWISLTCRTNPILFGIYAGFLAHFRAQMVSIPFVFPFLLVAFSSRRFFSQTVFPLVFGFGIGYGALALTFAFWIHSIHAESPVGFYTTYWANSMLGLADRATIAGKFATAIGSLFSASQLSFLAPIAVICALLRRCLPSTNLALGSVVYISVPIVLYSFDRYFQPAARYYIFAVPLIVLAAFLALEALQRSRPRLLLGWFFPSIALASAFTWYGAWGIPWANLRPASFISRAQYLDFPGADVALARQFGNDDIVIVNHPLPTGLSRLHNVIYVPPIKKFLDGDNRQIAGLVFVYSNSSPNDFFAPKDWFVGGALPTVISDHHALNFQQVFSKTSSLLNPDGSPQNEAYFIIYKRKMSQP